MLYPGIISCHVFTTYMHLNERIYQHITEGAAIRTRFELQPAGGVGTKVFPPTYQGQNNAVYATEQRKIDNGSVAECVLLDSVQSQANRMEEALKRTDQKNDLSIPLIQVDFTPDFPDLGKISTLDAPHRIADAIFREANYDGTPFRKTDYGQMFETSSMNDASELYQICPTALLFGAWDSTGERGAQQGTKFPRAITSEIVGVGVEKGVDPAGRISPIDITGTESSLYETEDGQLTHDEDNARDPDESMKPSEANLGNVTPSFIDDSSGELLPGGVTMDYAELSAVISVSGLRRLAFPVDGTSDQQRSRCGRAALAALGLVAVAKQYEMGYSLRSRCDLVPQENLRFEFIKRNGDAEKVDVSIDETVEAFANLHERAVEHGLDWKFETLNLEPTETLVEQIRRSRLQVAE